MSILKINWGSKYMIKERQPIAKSYWSIICEYVYYSKSNKPAHFHLT
jgi:hypothetical protein